MASQSERPRKKRRAYLAHSGQSIEDRRRIRSDERALHVSMKEHAADLAKLSSDRFHRTTSKLDDIYKRVCYPREANLDATNLDELNAAVVKQSQVLGSSDMTKYDAADLIRASRETCVSESQGGVFDWGIIGEAAGACFRSVPETNFLFGLMEMEVVEKEKKKPRRQRVSKEETSKLSQPSQYSAKSDRKDAQARRLEVLQNVMEKKRRSDLFDVVIDPDSFTQTVENMFDVSFLVRNGAVEIGVDNDTGIPYIENHEGRKEENWPASTQSIVSITPEQWEQLAMLQGEREPLVGHRG